MAVRRPADRAAGLDFAVVTEPLAATTFDRASRVSSYTSSGSSRRSSSMRQSRTDLRGSAIVRSGCPGWVKVASWPSGRTSSMSPDRRSNTTDTMPCPLEVRTRRTGMSRQDASQPASSWVEGESAVPVTVARVTGSCGGRSRAAAR